MTASNAPTSVGTHHDTAELEPFRRELTAYCYRMLGSNLEADDAVQETMLRAWRGLDRFEGRSSLRSWLYRIATNVCLDMQRGPQRRARPIDLGGPSRADGALAAPWEERAWVTPMSDGRVVPDDADPAEAAAIRDSIRLAFVAALQHLPPRQRVVLILREVLRWQASEVAELLDTSVASVNSALQRARVTLAEVDVTTTATDPLDADHSELLARYLDAFARYDVTSLVALLRDDVRFSMPPYPMWLQGPDQVAAWLTGPGKECAGSRVVHVGMANGCPMTANYRVSPDGGYHAWALHLLEIADGKIVGWTNFLDPAQFEAFGLPLHLDD